MLEEVPGAYLNVSACAHADHHDAEDNHSPRAAFDDAIVPDVAAALAAAGPAPLAPAGTHERAAGRAGRTAGSTEPDGPGRRLGEPDGSQRCGVEPGARETHRSVDVGFRLADRDKRVAAGVLAGGLAYRMFFWLLSVSVISTGALGVVDGSWLDEALRELGLGPTAADTIEELVRDSDKARWWVVLVGGWLLLWTGYLGAKALVLVHAAVWGIGGPSGEEAVGDVPRVQRHGGRLPGSDVGRRPRSGQGWRPRPGGLRGVDRDPVRPVARGEQPAPARGCRLEGPGPGRAPGRHRHPGVPAVRGVHPQPKLANATQSTGSSGSRQRPCSGCTSWVG